MAQQKVLFSSEIQKNFDNLRVAVEDRRYEDVEELLQEQRSLVKDLSIADPDVRDALMQAQELTLWSLAMIKMQRVDLERNLAVVTQVKKIEEYKSCKA